MEIRDLRIRLGMDVSLEQPDNTPEPAQPDKPQDVPVDPSEAGQTERQSIISAD